jgi:hypothetical protein
MNCKLFCVLLSYFVFSLRHNNANGKYPRLQKKQMKYLMILILILCVSVVMAQNAAPAPAPAPAKTSTIQLDGEGNFVAISAARVASVNTATGKFFITAKGEKFPVKQTSSGRYFVERTSKKTGNIYRQYMPLVESNNGGIK